MISFPNLHVKISIPPLSLLNFFKCEIFELVCMYVLLITSPKHLTLRQQNQMPINPNRISISTHPQNKPALYQFLLGVQSSYLNNHQPS